MPDFTIEAYQILQICSSERKAFHKLNILNQLKSFSQFGGRGFDIGIAQETLNELTNDGFISYLENIDSYKITDKGMDVLEE